MCLALVHQTKSVLPSVCTNPKFVELNLCYHMIFMRTEFMLSSNSKPNTVLGFR